MEKCKQRKNGIMYSMCRSLKEEPHCVANDHLEISGFHLSEMGGRLKWLQCKCEIQL